MTVDPVPAPGETAGMWWQDDAAFHALVDEFQARSWTLGVSESLTGGLLGFLLTRCDGAGAVFAGSLVTYSSDVKRRLLDVPPGPVVSAKAATAMAASARKLLATDVGVSLTGVAGPDPQDGEPVGTVFVACCSASGDVVERFELAGTPDAVRYQAAVAAAGLVLSFLDRAAHGRASALPS